MFASRLSIAFLVLAQFLLVLGQKSSRPCKRNEFTCDNGKCIQDISPCDGVKDCDDGSDETSKLCSNLSCPIRTFKCDYGACIYLSLLCDGKADCHDGSDEKCGQDNKVNVTINKLGKEACDKSNFSCATGGECIDSFLVCDATRDCSDGSDESKNVCKGINCGELGFQCRYGACVDRSKKCDGIKDCPDDSDEDFMTCPHLFVPTKKPLIKGCHLPEKPIGGSYQVNCHPSSVCPSNAGEILVRGNLVYSCDPGYTLSTSTHNFAICVGTMWTPLPYCYKNCTGLSSRSVEVLCSFNGNELDSCTGEVLPNTKARVRCKTHYKNDFVRESDKNLVCHKNGTWNQPLFKCQPRCGEPLSNRFIPFISYGNHTDSREHPWQVIMYILDVDNSFKFACGGTIISPDFVLTASHCVFIAGTQYKFRRPEEIKIAVGKYNSTWDYHDVNEQRFDVKKVIVPTDYRHEDGFFVQDIALLQLEKDIQFNIYVMPACLDCDKKLIYRSGEMATIAGWGINENNVTSKVLKVAQLPYFTYEDCNKKTIDLTFKKFLTSDKFCVSYRYDSSPGPSGVQEGDSGGGLTIVNEADQLHYVFGVVSIKDNIKSSMALFTNVTLHLNWIWKHLYPGMVRGCHLK